MGGIRGRYCLLLWLWWIEPVLVRKGLPKGPIVVIEYLSNPLLVSWPYDLSELAGQKAHPVHLGVLER